MTKARLDGLYLVILGSAVFLLLGAALEMSPAHPISDFRFVYISARCLFEQVDPYKQSEFLRVYQANGGDLGSGNSRLAPLEMEMAQHMYLPTSFIIAPLALLPWAPALAVWTILIAASFILAAFLMWHLGAEHAPVLSGLLVCLLLAGSELLIVIGNAAGLVISFCVIAVWCFVEDRFVAAGIACLAISLMLKPHDGGLVWLYFLLAGGVYRKRALQTLAATAAFSLPTVLWVTHVAPGWLRELSSNLGMLSAHGHLNDPGPASLAGHGIAMVIDLQSVISIFRDDPRIYNDVSYLVCGSLVLVWALTTMRSRPTPARTWLALASISALSMLPTYHRLGDSKLLLLAIPACALLWAEHRAIRWIALAVTAAGILLTGELQWAMILGALNHLPAATTWFSGQLRMAAQVFPVPLTLLIAGVFYLWVLLRRDSELARSQNQPSGPSA